MIIFRRFNDILFKVSIFQSKRHSCICIFVTRKPDNYLHSKLIPISELSSKAGSSLNSESIDKVCLE